MSTPTTIHLTARTPATTPLVWCALACTIVLDSLGQLLWKQLATALPDSSELSTLLVAAAGMRAVWLMALLLLVQLFVWLAILRRTELSFAQPLTSLSYVSVSLLSVVWLGEPMHLRTALSVLLILLGVLLISGVPVWTSRPAAERQSPP